ncbi:uncharacterized protein LOC144328972 [Podarcis muralis]
MQHYLSLYQSSPCETAALANTSLTTNKFTKHKHLKYLPKRTLLGNTKSRHQAFDDMTNTDDDGNNEGTHITDESHQTAKGVTVNGIPEQHFENGGNRVDLEAASEGKKSSSPKMSSFEENAEQKNSSAEEEKIDQECEITKGETEETCKHSSGSGGGDEEDEGDGEQGKATGHESCPDGKSSIQPNSEEAANQPSDSDTEIEKNNDEIMVEDACESHQTEQERADLIPEFCEVPQVCQKQELPAFPLYQSFV